MNDHPSLSWVFSYRCKTPNGVELSDGYGFIQISRIALPADAPLSLDEIRCIEKIIQQRIGPGLPPSSIFEVTSVSSLPSCVS